MKQNTISCGQCNFEFTRGAHVCQGCRGDIVYGATKVERSDATKIGLVLAGAAAMACVYGIPILLNEKLGTTIAPGFGSGFYGMAIVAVCAVFGAAYAVTIVEKRKASFVRTFRVRYVS